MVRWLNSDAVAPSAPKTSGQLRRALPSTVTTMELTTAGPIPVLATTSFALDGAVYVENSRCGQTSARSCARCSDASYNPTATAEMLTTSAEIAMKVSGS